MLTRKPRGALRRSGTSKLKEHPSLRQFFRDLEWDRSNQDAYAEGRPTRSLTRVTTARSREEFSPSLASLERRRRRRGTKR
jgi:hypothetical protein